MLLLVVLFTTKFINRYLYTEFETFNIDIFRCKLYNVEGNLRISKLIYPKTNTSFERKENCHDL